MGKAKRVPLPTKEMTPAKWKTFLEHIAHGTPRHEAVQASDITGQTLQMYLYLEPDAVDQYRAAQSTWLKRDWPFELLEQVLDKIASGHTVKDACQAHDIDFRRFIGLVMKDAALKEMYDDARQIALEIIAEDTLKIADESRLDRDELGKPNHELINRDRLRVQARQWMLTRLHNARYGDKVQKTVNKEVTVNHVDTLEGARKRKEAAHTRRLQLQKKQSDDKPIVVH